jgi:hypothetical protein
VSGRLKYRSAITAMSQPIAASVLPIRPVPAFGVYPIVTGDAGLCARENAALVTKLARWYVFGLKGNQARASADRV